MERSARPCSTLPIHSLPYPSKTDKLANMNREDQTDKTTAGQAIDAILVPGGGVRSDGDLPIWVKLRLDKALEIGTGVPIITLSAGTIHKAPPLQPNGWPVTDAVAMAQYLERREYPSSLIWPEAASHDTIGNAYFARLIHVQPAGLRKLLIITSEFHMPRTETIFRWIFSLDQPCPAYSLEFCETPNLGMSQEILEARLRKEKLRIESLQAIVPRHTTMASVHQWLFTEHSAYAIATLHLREVARDKLLDSY
jgi:hypothetical protein